MNARTTTILGWLTLIAVLVAVWLLFGETGRRDTAPGAQEKLYPALAERINDTAEIAITGYKAAVHLTRDGEDWRIAEKDGYPADPEKVRRLLKGVVRTEIVARKTDRPKYYERLELDPKHEKRLVLRAAARQKADGADGADGGTLVDLHVGKRRFMPRQRRFETFVRREGENRVLLVAGLPEVKAEAGTWLPDEILDIDFARVRSLVVRHPDGETLTIRRDEPGGDFELAEKKKGEVYKGYRPTDHVVNALAYVALEDVRRADGFRPDGAGARVEVATFDGLRLTMTLFPAADESGDHWMRLAADVAPEVAARAKGGTSTEAQPGKEEKDGAAPSPKADADAEVEDARKVVAEADRLARLADGWMLLVPASTVEQLLKRRDDLVRPGEPQDEGGKKTGTRPEETAGDDSGS